MANMAEVKRRETSVLSSEGRVVIPASIRKELGLEPGVTLTFRAENGRVVMSTRDAAIAELQRLFAAHPNPSGLRASDELIAERHAEAAREALEG
jgi:AbrB family looped-hinge helix DNA binding protein